MFSIGIPPLKSIWILLELINARRDTMWNLASRVHKLNHFPDVGVECYVKRDDELSCGISGSKIRKYASLVPFFIDRGIKHLIIIAGPQSNNLLAGLQVARELQLSVTLFLLKPKSVKIQGNFKLSLLFIKEEEIIWVERDNWDKVNDLATDFLHTLKAPSFILHEGASVPEALDGAMSLAGDVLRNEQQLGFTFQHIFIDAGTGFTAAALIKGLAEVKHQALIHVLLLADSEAIFQHKLNQWLGSSPENYSCLYPRTARSFGALNQTIIKEIKQLAREEGILTDPIYSAKLFHEARTVVANKHIKGKVLIIHSGGILTLPAFDF